MNIAAVGGRRWWVVLLVAACAAAEDSRAVGQGIEPPAHEAGRVPPPGPYAPGFDALHYHISVDLTGRGSRFSGRTGIRIALVEPRPDTLRLDLTGLLVTSVSVGVEEGTPVPVLFRQEDGRLILAVPAHARVGDELAVDVVYHGEPDDGLIIRSNVHGDPGVFADNWPDRARFWFPSIDHPSDKATAEFEVRVPPGWEVIANGLRIIEAGEENPSGQPSVWRWSIAEPIPTYLMVIGATDFAIGDVATCAAGGRTPARVDGCVTSRYWVFPQDSAQAARIFARAGDMLRYYAELIAPFPYARLDHVQSATRFGGMENATAIFYSEAAIANGTLGEATVAHEIVHQWFGDAVTPGRWSDLWLSEGFATYFGMLYFEATDGADVFRQKRESSWNQYLQSGDAAIAMVDTARVPNDNLLSLLNANSYNKGGAVLHMLRGLLGDDAFFTGIRRYYAAHAHENAVTADLRRALEAVSSRDLDWFFEQWVYSPGHPILRVEHDWNPTERQLTLTIEQVQSEDWPTFRMPMEVEVETAAGRERSWVELTGRRTAARLAFRSAPSAVRLDPDGWLLKETAR